MAGHRKAGKIVSLAGRFAKEMGIQIFCILPPVRKLMNEADKAIARRDRYNKVKDGSWKEHGGVGGQAGLYFDR